jgi:hypothetical protein
MNIEREGGGGGGGLRIRVGNIRERKRRSKARESDGKRRRETAFIRTTSAVRFMKERSAIKGVGRINFDGRRR